MAQLIILQDATFRNYVESFRSKFSAPQWKYFVTILMGLLHRDGAKTLSGFLREVATMVTMSGLSRFLISPAWSVISLEQVCYEQFHAQVQPRIVQAHQDQKSKRAKHRGRPKPTVVTGYLIMDDSTHAKRYYRKSVVDWAGTIPILSARRCKDTTCSRQSMLWKSTSIP